MPETDYDIERLAPQKLLERFSKGRVLLCLVAAIVLHVVIIGGLSTRYIYYNWINPEAGVAREEAAKKAAEKAASLAAGEAIGTATATDTNSTAKSQTSAAGDDATQQELLEKHKSAPVVKAITEAAAPDEIPTEPDSLGISIEDTNL